MKIKGVLMVDPSIPDGPVPVREGATVRGPDGRVIGRILGAEAQDGEVTATMDLDEIIDGFVERPFDLPVPIEITVQRP